MILKKNPISNASGNLDRYDLCTKGVDSIVKKRNWLVQRISRLFHSEVSGKKEEYNILSTFNRRKSI